MSLGKDRIYVGQTVERSRPQCFGWTVEWILMERVRSEPSVGRLSSTEPNSSGESVGCMFGGDFRGGCKSGRLGIISIQDIEREAISWYIFFSFFFFGPRAHIYEYLGCQSFPRWSEIPCNRPVTVQWPAGRSPVSDSCASWPIPYDKPLGTE